jgi:broad specificity phosphatase PhoE
VKLYLVRHSAVTLRPDVPSAQWHLSPEGRAGADSLADEPFWPEVRAVYASTEPKAEATAQRIAARHALPVRIEADPREVERPWVEGDYKDAVRRYLAGEALAGWEPRDRALARVRQCIDGIVRRHEERDVAVVSHGIALTLYVAALLDLDAGRAYDAWSRIRFPDVAILDPAARRLERAFGG